MQSATKGPVSIESVAPRLDFMYSAMFAHNPNLEKSAVGGLALLWVLIPRSDAPVEEKNEGDSGLKRLLRADDGDQLGE